MALNSVYSNIQPKVANNVMKAAKFYLVADKRRTGREDCGYATGRQWMALEMVKSTVSTLCVTILSLTVSETGLRFRVRVLTRWPAMVLGTEGFTIALFWTVRLIPMTMLTWETWLVARFRLVTLIFLLYTLIRIGRLDAVILSPLLSAVISVPPTSSRGGDITGQLLFILYILIACILNLSINL